MRHAKRGTTWHNAAVVWLPIVIGAERGLILPPKERSADVLDSRSDETERPQKSGDAEGCRFIGI